MTRKEILAMKPGRELDALVKEVVFKEKVVWGKTPNAVYPRDTDTYSTSEHEAWAVIKRINKSKKIRIGIEVTPSGKVWVGIGNIVDGDKKVFDCQTKNLPESLCKAANVPA